MDTGWIVVREPTGVEAAALVPALAAILRDCVGHGASVSFMNPLSDAKAVAFWEKVARDVASGARILITAENETGEVVGTVQLIVDQPENQPHRADLAKMLVHTKARRRGVGEALLQAAEAAALEAGRTLLVLDTASAEAERLYVRGGWQRVGVVPGFALLPDGPPCATTFFYKELAPG